MAIVQVPAAQAGGMTLLSTTTLTGATVTLSSIPQTYNKLFLVFRNFLPANDGSSIYMRFNGDSAANRHVVDSYYSVFYYDTSFAFGGTSSRISSDNDNVTGNGLVTCEIFDYTNTATWKMAEYTSLTTSDSNTAQYKHRKGAIFYNQTSAISSLTFLATSGNFTSGSVLLYGVK